MNLSSSSFDRLSVPVQSVVLVALSAPPFAIFLIVGDVSRGALAWTFLGALMIVVNAQRKNASFKQLGLPAAILLIAHIPVMVWNPLKGTPFYGGIIQPLAVMDGCIDYAFVWLCLNVFKTKQ